MHRLREIPEFLFIVFLILLIIPVGLMVHVERIIYSDA